MTKAKEVETETFDGAGATAGLILKRKPTNKSGYYGGIPNGKGWRARVYKDNRLPTPVDTSADEAPEPRPLPPADGLLGRQEQHGYAHLARGAGASAGRNDPEGNYAPLGLQNHPEGFVCEVKSLQWQRLQGLQDATA